MTDLRLVRPLWRGRENVDALTIACIERAEALAGHQFVVTKGSYQPPDRATNSAHTHDEGGVVDLRECGHLVCLVHLRRAGMAAWRRTPAQGFDPHFHACVVGHPLLHPEAEDQVRQYLTNTGNGLRGSTRDDGPRLDPIPRPIWPWPQEDPVTPEEIQKVAAETVKQLLDANVAAEGPNVRTALRRAAKTPDALAELEDDIADRVVELVQQHPGSSATTDDIKAAVKQALREGTGG